MLKRVFFLLIFTIVMIQATVPTRENITELYVAMFDRAPDSGGLEYWLDSGIELEEMAQLFFEQDETIEKYPPDILINISKDIVGFFEFDKEKELVRIGREVTVKSLE